MIALEHDENFRDSAHRHIRFSHSLSFVSPSFLFTLMSLYALSSRKSACLHQSCLLHSCSRKYHKAAQPAMSQLAIHSKWSQHCVCFWKFSMVKLAVKAGMQRNLPMNVSTSRCHLALYMLGTSSTPRALVYLCTSQQYVSTQVTSAKANTSLSSPPHAQHGWIQPP